MIKWSQTQSGFVKHILQILKPVYRMSCYSFLLFWRRTLLRDRWMRPPLLLRLLLSQSHVWPRQALMTLSLRVVTKDDDNDVTLNVESLELRMYRLIVADNMEIVFPNTWIALRIYLSLVISFCSGERSFSKLRRIKNELRSCMTQKRLNIFTLLRKARLFAQHWCLNIPYKASTSSTNWDALSYLWYWLNTNVS